MIVEREKIKAFLNKHFLFKQLDENTVEAIAFECGVLSVKPNKDICVSATTAKAFFILLSGSAFSHDVMREQSILLSGDCFGYEALAKKPSRYQKTVTAKDQSIVLLIEPDKFLHLINSNSDLKKLIRLLARFASINTHKNLSWLNPTEGVKYITRRHAYDLYRKLAAPGSLVLIGLLVSIILFSISSPPQPSIYAWFGMVAGLLALWAAWLILDWCNDYYVVTDLRIALLERTFLLYETRQETPLEAIQTIGIASELLGRLLSYGSVNVKTYTGSVALENLEAPALIADMLDHYISRQKIVDSTQSSQEYKKMLQDRLARPGSDPHKQIGSVVRMQEPKAVRTGKRLFALKEITPDALVYRTHWFILIKKVALSLLFFCIGIALLIFYFQGQLSIIPKDYLLTSSIIVSIIGLLSMLYQFADWHNDQYIITHDQLIDINRKPLGHEEKRAALLRNIQTIEYKRKGIFGLLFNFGTVFIRVGDTELTFDYVQNPSQVQQELFAHFMRITQQEKKAELQAESDRMVDWIKAYHHITNSHEENSQPGKNG